MELRELSTSRMATKDSLYQSSRSPPNHQAISIKSSSQASTLRLLRSSPEKVTGRRKSILANGIRRTVRLEVTRMTNGSTNLEL